MSDRRQFLAGGARARTTTLVKSAALATIETGQRLGRYHLIEPLGGGPCGEVYRAKVVGVAGMDRQFAVKRIHQAMVAEPGVSAKLSHACRTYAALDHPRIARMAELGVGNGETFTVTELVSGLDLSRLQAAVSQSGGALSGGPVLALVSAAARAVGYAHGRGANHLGLCPTNLVATSEGDVRVTDFGVLACRLGPRPAEDPSLAARLPYLAPEQLLGEPVSAATDVFCLGVIAYELVASARPFWGATALELEQAILSGRPEPLELPRPVARVIDRCLARSPFERFPDARALADALDAALRQAPLDGDRRELGDKVREALEQLARAHDSQLSGAFSFAIPVAPSAPPRPRPAMAAVPLPLPPIPSPSGAIRSGARPASPDPGPGSSPAIRIPMGPLPTAPVPGPAAPAIVAPIAPAPALTEPALIEPALIEPAPIEPAADEIVAAPVARPRTPAMGVPVLPVAIDAPAAVAPPSPSPVAAVPDGPVAPAPVAVSLPAVPPPPVPSRLGVTAMLPSVFSRTKPAKAASALTAPAAPAPETPSFDAAPAPKTPVAFPAAAPAPGAEPPPSMFESLWPPTEPIPVVRSDGAEADLQATSAAGGEPSLFAPPRRTPRAVEVPTFEPAASGEPGLLPPPPPMLVHVTGQPVASGAGGGRRGLYVALAALALAGAAFAAVTVVRHRHAAKAAGPPASVVADAGTTQVAIAPPVIDAAAVPLPLELDAAPMAAVLPDAAEPIDAAAKPVIDGAVTPPVDAAAAKPPIDAAPAKPPIDAAPAKPPVDAAEEPTPTIDTGPPATGDTLVLDLQPHGARVFVDGHEVGKSPATIPGTDDRRDIAGFAPGRRLYTATVAGRGQHRATLAEAPHWGGSGGIKVRCKAARRFYVFVDGKDTGQLCPTERIGLAVGKHTVEIYDPLTRARRSFPADVVDTDHSLKVDVD